MSGALSPFSISMRGFKAEIVRKLLEQKLIKHSHDDRLEKIFGIGDTNMCGVDGRNNNSSSIRFYIFKYAFSRLYIHEIA